MRSQPCVPAARLQAPGAGCAEPRGAAAGDPAVVASSATRSPSHVCREVPVSGQPPPPRKRSGRTWASSAVTENTRKYPFITAPGHRKRELAEICFGSSGRQLHLCNPAR